MERIGERMRRLRADQGISRHDLARRTGVSYTMIADLENGRAKGSTKLHLLARELGTSADYLQTGRISAPAAAAPAGDAAKVDRQLHELRIAQSAVMRALAEFDPGSAMVMAETIAAVPGGVAEYPYLQGVLRELRTSVRSPRRAETPTT